MNKKFKLFLQKEDTIFWDLEGCDPVYHCEFKTTDSCQLYEISFLEKTINGESLYVFLNDKLISYWSKNTSKFKPIFYINKGNQSYNLYIVCGVNSFKEAKNYIYKKNQNL
jgi:hypothetical protein